MYKSVLSVQNITQKNHPISPKDTSHFLYVHLRYGNWILSKCHYLKNTKKKKYIIILYGFRFPMQESRVTKTLMVYIYTIYIQFIYIFIHSFPQLGNFLGVSDRRTHFTRQTVQPICKIWSVLQYVYVPTTSSSLDW